jgi:hypothetical protein
MNRWPILYRPWAKGNSNSPKTAENSKSWNESISTTSSSWIGNHVPVMALSGFAFPDSTSFGAQLFGRQHQEQDYSAVMLPYKARDTQAITVRLR